jgi:hypothetical protein
MSITLWYEWITKNPSWQIACFRYSPRDGWRVDSVFPIYSLVKPVIKERRNILYVEACFKRKLRAGQFCKHPHKLIDFDNSYERKESLQGS